MAAPVRDFTSWLQDGRLSDVALRIVLEAAPQRQEGDGKAAAEGAPAAPAAPAAEGSARKRRVLEGFAAHALILEEASGWAAAMLRSPESRESQQRSLDIVVGDEAEGAAAGLLVRMMYAGCPTTLLEEQTQLMLLQVLRLADRLQAPRCIEAAGAALAAVKPLEWETVAAVWALPGGCADNPAYAAAFNAAAAAVQQQLGDLDAALAYSRNQKQLLALPFGALLQLLESDETCVSSENVAFWVADKWLHAHGGGSEEQQQQLAAALRLHHMSGLYLKTVVSQCDWVTRHVEWRPAAAYAVGPEALRTELSGGKRYPELHRPARPASAVTEGVVRWDVTLAQLKALHEDAAAADVGESAWEDSGALAWWGGFSWQLRLSAQHETHGVRIGLFLAPDLSFEPEALPLAAVFVDMRVLASGGFNTATHAYEAVDGTWGWGYSDFFELGVRPAWDEGAWRAGGVVSEGGLVRLQATICAMH